MKKLFLIDGNSYCYRAFYAIKGLANSQGLPTNAVYGFIMMLKKLIASESPDYLAVAFDLKGPTFRHKKFKEYKIHRKPMPDELITQMPLIKKILDANNIRLFEKEGYEADDILATIANKANAEGLDVYIVTGDKDALQLVNDRIKVYSANKEGFIYDKAAVKEKFGVTPETMVDLIALMGDSTDNIPGVRGIGQKTASGILEEFGNIEELYKNLDKIKSVSRKSLLETEKKNAFLSKELAILDTEVPIDIPINEMAIKEPDKEALLKLYKEFEFKALAKEIATSDSKIRKDASYTTITTKKDFNDFIAILKKEKQFVLDFETTSANPHEAIPVGISFSWEKGKAFYVELGKKIELDLAFEALKPILEQEDIKKIGQNIKYEKLILSRYGVELKGIEFDTMLASYLLNPSKLNHNLDDISFEYLDHKMISLDDLLGTGKKRIPITEAPIERLSEYACEDSDITLRLKKVLDKKLFEKELDKLFREIELPLIEVLSYMELNGVKIDSSFLKKMSRELEKELSSLIKDIYKLAGCEFNINSPKQLAKILFEKLELPAVKKTKTGFSTDVSVLERLSHLHPLPKELLRYRELTKLKSTYVDALPELINKNTGRLHTSFNQTVTQTGRLSSSNPNLQNIPIKTEEGRRIRKAFIGEGANIILSCDYSQIELRILAHLSKDEELIRAFEEDRDIHTHTASLIFDVDEKEVTSDMRNNAKAVNFGIVYGISAFGLSRALSIDPYSAQEFIDNYFERYPRVKMYLEEVIEDAKSSGYVTTLFNRRRYVPQIQNGSMKERQQAERIAINMPVQGSAADLIKIAMIDIYKELKKRRLKSLMLLQVHDELVFEVPKEELDIMIGLVREKMENAIKLLVSTKVSVKYGKNWLETEEG
ncbi:MAG: DNA polymerase I [Candidatus Omnitrophota bacterium]